MSERRDTVGTIREASFSPSIHTDHGIYTPCLQLKIDDEFGTFDKELGSFNGGLEAIAFLRQQQCSVEQLIGTQIKVYEKSSWGFIHEDEFDWNIKDAQNQLRLLRLEFPELLIEEYERLRAIERERHHEFVVRQRMLMEEIATEERDEYSMGELTL